MTKLALLIALLCSAACVDQRPAFIEVHAVGSHEFIADVQIGAQMWRSLGYESGAKAPLGVESIDVTFLQVVGLYDAPSTDGRLLGRADQERRQVIITDYLRGAELQHVAGHELGHVLFGSAHLTQAGQNGVMRAGSSWLLAPTFDDYTLICRESGVCGGPSL